MKALSHLLLSLMGRVKSLGIGEIDLKNATGFFAHNEYGLCFDTIVTQMYEYSIEIDNEFYKSIVGVADKMNLPVDSYVFMKELIRE